MNTWTDFNDAEQQQSFDLIPKGTVARVRMTIKPGGFDDPSQGWTGGYATRNDNTGSVYLNCEFVVMEGEFARRKMWSLIGLYSPKGPEWTNIGRSFLRAILNSARGIHPADNSPQAQSARRIKGFADLDGVEFVARIDVEKDQNGDDKNVIKAAIQPDHKEYAALMGQPMRTPSHASSAPPTGTPPVSSAPAVPTRPAWAQ